MKIKVKAIFCTDISQIISSRAEYFMEEIVITLVLLLHYISVVNKISRESIVSKGVRVAGLQMLILLLGNMQCS